MKHRTVGRILLSAAAIAAIAWLFLHEEPTSGAWADFGDPEYVQKIIKAFEGK